VFYVFLISAVGGACDSATFPVKKTSQIGVLIGPNICLCVFGGENIDFLTTN
jgi:hypothetical protein